MLGDEFVVAAVDIVQQHLRSDDTCADAGLCERIAGELFLFGSLGVLRRLPCGLAGVGAEQLQRFVEQRDVGTGQRRAFRPDKNADIAVRQPWGICAQLVRLGEHLIDQPFAGHRQPCFVQGNSDLVVHAQLRDDVGQFCLIRLIIELLDVPVAQRAEHAAHEGFTRLVVWLACTFRVGDRLFNIRTEHGHFETVERNDRQSLWNAFTRSNCMLDRVAHAIIAF